MKKLRLLIISALLLIGGGNLLAYNCDPSGESWLGNGSGNPDYTDVYKVCAGSGIQEIVNIQKPGFASAPGIYVTVPAGISNCSLGTGNYDVQGAGIILHANAFTEKYTDVTITHGLGEGKLTVYNKNGGEPEPPSPEGPQEAPTAPTLPANQVKAVYSSTYNADCDFGEWGSGTKYSQDTYGKKYITANGGYFGMCFEGEKALDCSGMEGLRMAVYADKSFSIGIVPIYDPAADSRVTKAITAGEWNYIDISLSEFVGVPSWSNIYQIKIDNVPNQTFWINDVYFYTNSATPKITVTEKSLEFDAASSKSLPLNVTLANLTNDVTVSTSNPQFAIDKTSISKTTTSTTVNVTCSATTDAEGEITFTSTGAKPVKIPVTYKVWTVCDGKKFTATDGASTVIVIPTIEDDGYFFVIKGSNLSGLGGSFVSSCDGNKEVRTKEVKNTPTELKYGPFGNLPCTTKPAFYTPLYVNMPGEKIFNDVTFSDSEWCDKTTSDPSVEVEPQSLKFTSTGTTKDLTVKLYHLKSKVTVSVESDNDGDFVVDKNEISLGETSATVKVTCNATADASGYIVFSTEGMSEDVKIPLSFKNGEFDHGLFDPATTTMDTYFAIWDWSADTESSADYNSETGDVDVHIKNDKGGQWQAQIKLLTDIKDSKKLDGKKLQVKFKLKSNVDLGSVTFKIFDDTGTIYENQTISLTANTEFQYDKTITEGVPTSSKGTIVWDFGSAKANTEIQIYDIAVFGTDSNAPTIEVPKSVLFTATEETKEIPVKGENLKSDISIEYDATKYEITPSSIAKGADGKVSTTVSIKNIASETFIADDIRFYATDADDQILKASYYVNTECDGFGNENQADKPFEIGYLYHFETNGNAVTARFEYLDNKNCDAAYLWNQGGSPFETQMSVSNNVATVTLDNQTKGATLQLACKFAFAGGTSVTKYYSYKVGENCKVEPSLFVTPAKSMFTSKGETKIITVTMENLTDDITVSVPAGFEGAETISKNEQSPYSYQITCVSDDALEANITFSTPGLETTLEETVALQYIINNDCNGLWTNFVETPSKDCSFLYNFQETADGQLYVQFDFVNGFEGNPQLNFAGNYRSMTKEGGKYVYTTQEGDFTKGSSSVTFFGYFAMAGGGIAQTTDITYTFGSCPSPMSKPVYNVSQDKGYDSMEEALAEAVAEDVLKVNVDLDESVAIDKYIKLNGNGKSVGDITIDLTGKLEITGATNFNTLIVKSKPNVGAGQVFTSDAGSATANAVYAEREFRDNFQQLWYSLALPFACDAASGLYNTNGTQITKGVWFNEYNSQKRADTGLSSGNWDYVTSLDKGTAYMIYMNEGINTVRFKAANPNDIFTQTTSIPYYKYDGSADAEHQGWNFMAQPMSSNAWMGVSAGSAGFIQVLREGGATASDGTTSGQYSTVQAFRAADVIAPYTAFMFQTDVNGEMSFHSSTLEAVIKSAEYEEPSYFKVTLSDAKGNTDATFVSASEDASATEYEIGKDLAKCGSSSAFVQITTTDLGLELTVNQAKAYNGEATIPLLLNCPAAGTYTVSVAEMSEIGDIYLLRNGSVVCDLGFESYTFNVPEKQLNKEYSLLIKLNGGVYTDADGATENSIYAKDRVIYVNGIYATEITNIAGQSVSNPVPEKGVYVVEDVKISVE